MSNTRHSVQAPTRSVEHCGTQCGVRDTEPSFGAAHGTGSSWIPSRGPDLLLRNRLGFASGPWTE